MLKKKKVAFEQNGFLFVFQNRKKNPQDLSSNRHEYFYIQLLYVLEVFSRGWDRCIVHTPHNLYIQRKKNEDVHYIRILKLYVCMSIFM